MSGKEPGQIFSSATAWPSKQPTFYSVTSPTRPSASCLAQSKSYGKPQEDSGLPQVPWDQDQSPCTLSKDCVSWGFMQKIKQESLLMQGHCSWQGCITPVCGEGIRTVCWWQTPLGCSAMGCVLAEAFIISLIETKARQSPAWGRAKVQGSHPIETHAHTLNRDRLLPGGLCSPFSAKGPMSSR